MRLHRLELEGFGPFRDRQVVDFDAFAHDGIFLISGRTGAGKSSILDGVSFALYGSVPRYDTGDKRLRSDHCEPEDRTEVRLEFTVGDRRWRVTRAPEYQRPSRRGGGLTTEPTRAELEELVDGHWVGRAAKPRDVGLLLDDVLALNAQQFQQVILLAQNKFSRFLLASGAERQSLLRALFGTRRYEEYTRELAERGKAAQRELDAIEARARTLLDQAERLVAAHDLDGGGEAQTPHDLAGRRARVELAAQRGAYRLDTRQRERAQAEAARTEAEAAHTALVALAKAQTELSEARERLRALEDEATAVAADRTTLERARAAEALRAPLETARRARAAADAATAAATDADETWSSLARDAALDEATDLESVIERLTGDLAVWASAASQEAALPAQEEELRVAVARVAELDADLAALDGQRGEIPVQVSRLDEAIDAARETAALLDPARARLSDLETRLAAAREAEALAPALRSAESAHHGAAAAAATAAARVATLLQRRLDGYAGELAATLVEGEACAVCGSIDHPQPASPADEPVTDEMLAAAEDERDASIASERAAAEAARAARERHAEAIARAGGTDAAALQEETAIATADVAAAQAAVARRDALVGERAQLLALSAQAETARAELAASLGDHRSAVAALDAGVQAVRTAVADARGDFDTVAARVAAAARLRDAARACATARTEAVHADAARALAEDDLETRITASVFADAASVTAALAAPGALAALADRIATHEAQLTATRGRVLELELELAGTDEQEIDVTASRARLDAADAARTAAIGAERDAHVTAASLRDLVQQIDDASANVAERAAEAAAIARLADTVAGRAPNTMKMDLETFVLAAELEEIVDAANVRFGDMSAGRYRLQHTDARAARGAASGLGLEIVDAYTGQARPAQSLSGGETFLASLALALGLAEVVTARAGGVRLDTLFIDEGFGSLDEETLDLAMRTLDELRQGGRTVGVISHVAAMKEQLPAQLTVESTPNGPSRISQPAAVSA